MEVAMEFRVAHFRVIMVVVLPLAMIVASDIGVADIRVVMLVEVLPLAMIVVMARRVAIRRVKVMFWQVLVVMLPLAMEAAMHSKLALVKAMVQVQNHLQRFCLVNVTILASAVFPGVELFVTVIPSVSL